MPVFIGEIFGRNIYIWRELYVLFAPNGPILKTDICSASLYQPFLIKGSKEYLVRKGEELLTNFCCSQG